MHDFRMQMELIIPRPSEKISNHKTKLQDSNMKRGKRKLQYNISYHIDFLPILPILGRSFPLKCSQISLILMQKEAVEDELTELPI